MANQVKSIQKKLKNLRLKEKSSFIKTYLANDVEIIKKLYSSVGYNFVKVETKINQIDNQNFDLLIEISEEKESQI